MAAVFCDAEQFLCHFPLDIEGIALTRDMPEERAPGPSEMLMEFHEVTYLGFLDHLPRGF